MEVLNIYLSVLDYIAVGISAIILVSSADDFFIDVYYWVRRLYRALVIRKRYPPLELKELQKPKEQWLAVMIPAWEEHEVIANMVKHFLSTMEYTRYMVFIGTYQNDSKTTKVVEELSKQYNQVFRVKVPINGPTCKADCLNWIIQAILLKEKERKGRFAGIIMHDCEDVVHPLELKLYNFLLPKKDFIQLPVLSLERGWREWVGGTYMDDFAEFHQKDLVVRESLTGFVPGAGVASCYGRRIIKLMVEKNANQPFNTKTLTEDYDFSFRMKEWKASQVFVTFPVQYPVMRRRLFRGSKQELVKGYIATRELFPDKFVSAYRQRARWILGIALQGWESQRWKGGFWTKYFLWRDRKGLLTSLVTVLAYLLVVNFIAIYLIRAWDPSAIPQIWPKHEALLLAIMSINLFFLANRIIHGSYFVGRLYGWEQAILSFPRLIINNLINFAATVRAWKMFINHLFTGEKVLWDKTDHIYPSQSQLLTYRRRLGDMLLELKAIDKNTLDSMLAGQAESGKKLGKLLIDSGIVSAKTVADAIAKQNNMRRANVNFQLLNQNLNHLPHRLMVKYQVIPLQLSPGPILKVGVCMPLSNEGIREIKTFKRLSVVQFIVTESEMSESLRQVATGKIGKISGRAPSKPLLGDVLIGLKIINQNQLANAIRHYDPKKDGRLGDYLVKQNVITEESLMRALTEQSGKRDALVKPSSNKRKVVPLNRGKGRAQFIKI